MDPELLAVLLAAAAIVVLIILITRFKVNPFAALLISALALGLVSGLGASATVSAFTSGFGSVLATTGPVIGLGALLGGLLIGTGGADRIASVFIGSRPVKWIPALICAAALLIGMPHLFDVSFIMLCPLVYAIAKRTNTHLLWVGLPMAAGLYVSHGLLPPHPSPTVAVAAYGANTGLTIFYGLLIAIPTAIICGPLFTKLASRWFGPAPDLNAGIMAGVKAVEYDDTHRQAGFIPSLISVLLPPALMLTGTLGMTLTSEGTVSYGIFEALNNSVISLLIAVIFAMFALGIVKKYSFADVGKMASSGLKPIGPIVLILGAGGGLKGMLSATSVDQIISDHSTSWVIPPLVLAWLVAALLRICLGSATVATAAAAAIAAPLLVAHPGLSPELLVLATASGSVMLSHVNDSGFWLFKEYFQLSVSQTFRTWTLMLSIQSVVGLLGVLTINAFL